MLRRPRKAHHASHQRVVAAVSPLVGVRGDHFVEAVRRHLATVCGNIEAQPPQARRRHRHQQRCLALPAHAEIRQPVAHELVAGEVGGDFQHAPIVDGSSARPANDTFWTAVQRHEGRDRSISLHDPLPLPLDAQHSTTVPAAPRGIAHRSRTGAADTALQTGQRCAALRTGCERSLSPSAHGRRGEAVATRRGLHPRLSQSTPGAAPSISARISPPG